MINYKKKAFENQYLSFNNKVFIKTVKRKLLTNIFPKKTIVKAIGKRKKQIRFVKFRFIHFVKKLKRFEKRKSFNGYILRFKENEAILKHSLRKTRIIYFIRREKEKLKRRYSIQRKKFRKNKIRWSFVKQMKLYKKFKSYRALDNPSFSKHNISNLIKARYDQIIENKPKTNVDKTLLLYTSPIPEAILSNKITKFKPYSYDKLSQSSLHMFYYKFVATQLLNNLYGGVDTKLIKEISLLNLPELNKQSLIISTLERRLDTILVRMGFADSIFNSQQLISHGFVTVNDRIVKTKNYFVKPLEKIKVNLPNTPFNTKNLSLKLRKFLGKKEYFSYYKTELKKINFLIGLKTKHRNIPYILRFTKNKYNLCIEKKNVILFRKRKTKLFLIKAKILRKFKLSFIKLLTYLWAIYNFNLESQKTFSEDENIKTINILPLTKKKKKIKVYKEKSRKVTRLKKRNNQIVSKLVRYKTRKKYLKKEYLKKRKKFIKKFDFIKTNRFNRLYLRPFLPDPHSLKRIKIESSKFKIVKPLNLKFKTFKYPKYLHINFKTNTGILLFYPHLNQIPVSIDVQDKLEFINKYLKIA